MRYCREIIIAFALLAMVSCGREPSGAGDAVGSKVVFKAQYPSTKATATSFESGDKIGIYASVHGQTLDVAGNWADNVLATYDGSSWNASPSIYWGTDSLDFYAYSPYGEPSSMDEMEFKVGDFYESDFLWAKTSGVAVGEDVILNFKHIMSLLEVRLVKGDDYEGDLPTSATVLIHNTVPDARIDLTTGEVMKYAYSSAETLTATQTDTYTYSTIIVPQRMASKVPLVEILAGNFSYIAETKMTFKSGVRYIFEVKLNEAPDRTAITIITDSD